MLDDLTEDDLVVLNSGVFQASPGVDRFGRHIFISFPALRPECTPESMMKVMFYQMQQLFLQHDENHVQTRGLISKFFQVGLFSSVFCEMLQLRYNVVCEILSLACCVLRFQALFVVCHIFYS